MMLKKLLKLFSYQNDRMEEAVSQAKEMRQLADRKINAMMATLNGEDEWFLCRMKKENNPHGHVSE
jgi:predicted component of type VI protein secretion system